MALSVYSDLSLPLTESFAQRSPASSAPHQACACPGFFSTQVVFNDPADLNIFYLTRHGLAPAALLPRQVDGRLLSLHTKPPKGRQVKDRRGGGQGGDAMYNERWEHK